MVETVRSYVVNGARQKLVGTIINYNVVDRMYTVDFENGFHHRFARNEVRLIGIQNIDAADYIPEVRDRTSFYENLYAAYENEDMDDEEEPHPVAAPVFIEVAVGVPVQEGVLVERESPAPVVRGIVV